MEKLEEELKFYPNINQSKDSFNYGNVIEINNYIWLTYIFQILAK